MIQIAWRMPLERALYGLVQTFNEPSVFSDSEIPDAAVIADLSDVGELKVPLANKITFDPLPALQHAADRLQQAQDEIVPLREQRDALASMASMSKRSPISRPR